GRDLHDGIGQLLTAVRLLSEQLALNLAAEGHREAARAQRLAAIARDAQNEARTLSRDLAPALPAGDGLATVLDLLAALLREIDGVCCVLAHDGRTDVREPG